MIGTTDTTAQVQPELFTKAVLARAVGEYGVEVVKGKVVGVEVEEGGFRVKGVVVEGGRRVGGDAVVLAIGPWSGKFEMLSSIFRVYGLKAHSVVLEPRDPGEISAHALFLSYFPGGEGKALDPEVYPRPSGTFWFMAFLLFKYSHVLVLVAFVAREICCTFLFCSTYMFVTIGTRLSEKLIK